MLTGLWLGIAATFFWSITNLIDKHLTTKHAPDGDVSAILLLSALFPAVLLPISLFFSDISGNFSEIFTLMFTGILMVIWLFFYLKALVEDDASVVMALLVLTPIFSLIFSNLINGEKLETIHFAGGLTMIIGALIITYNREQKTFKYKLISYAVLACIIMGFMHSLFKLTTYEDFFWRSVFWRSLGMVLIGCLLYICFSKIRNSFHVFMKNFAKKGLALNTANESLTLIGDTIFAFAMLFSPLAVVQATESYQPVFIIIISIILAKFGMNDTYEYNNKVTYLQKIIGILIVLIGSLVLVLNNNITR